MNYTITLIISIAIILLSAIGIWTGFFEGIGQGAYNLHTLYTNSSDSGPAEGIMEDTVPYEDPANPVLAVDETFDEVLATITAYTSSVEETDNTPCLSASGVDLCKLIKGQEILWIDNLVGSIATTTGIATDKIIACPKKYDFGTIVGIPKKLDGGLSYYDEYICLDRMNSRYDGEERFDIYFGGPENRQKAMEWGVQKLKVKVYFLQ